MSDTKPNVLVTRRTFDEAAARLRESADVTILETGDPPDRDGLKALLRDVDGLYAHIVNEVDGDVMDAAPRLKVITEFGVGYDNIDEDAASERGIAVANTPGVLSETTADQAFGLLLATARRIPMDYVYVREGRWGPFDPLDLLGADVHHQTLGIVGMGRIGGEVAKRAVGFDMTVLYHNRNRRSDEMGAEYVSTLDELLERSDFVSIHAPLNDETRHLMSTPQFARMKPTAALINTSRGPVVDQKALYEALKSGEIAAAGLDVTDPEPMRANDPLLTLPNCVVVPHVASATVGTRMKMAMMCVDNVLAGINGEFPPYCVNREAIEGRSRLEGKA